MAQQSAATMTQGNTMARSLRDSVRDLVEGWKKAIVPRVAASSAFLHAKTTDWSARPRRAKVHMHPVKRRVLRVVVVGSIMGIALLFATAAMISRPLQRWQDGPLAMAAQLARLDAGVVRLSNATSMSELQMRQFLQQVQKLQAASTTRTGLVEQAAHQNYREHARDRLRQYFMATKEAILLQTSQRRRIDSARAELQSINLTYMARGDGAATPLEAMEADLAASSLLLENIKTIRAAILEHSQASQRLQTDLLAQHIAHNMTQGHPIPWKMSAGPLQRQNEQFFFAYSAIFAFIGAWLWFFVTDEATRRKNMLFKIQRMLGQALTRVLVVERIEGPDGDHTEELDHQDAFDTVMPDFGDDQRRTRNQAPGFSIGLRVSKLPSN